MASVFACGAPRLQSPLRVRAWISILIIFLPGVTAVVYAQTTPTAPQATMRPAVNLGAAPEASEVDLLVGRSTVLDVPTAIARVSLTSPDIADALVTTTQQVLIHGKTAGTISMFVWDRAGAIRRYEVTVRRDLSRLEAQMHNLFPGEPIAVASNGKDVIVSGTVSSKYVMDKAAEVAAGFVEKKENVVNLLQQVQGIASNQVLLRVRFAEVSRSALTELGSSFFTGVAGYKDWVGRTSTEQFGAPDFADGKLVFSDFLNFFLFNSKQNVGTLIKALQTRGLFQSLAEPNLVATNGREASFLAGGEYPYPVVQGTGAGTSVTIQFKEFGVKLNFTPTMLGDDLIHLKVRPEVSSLDFTNAVSIQGFRIPSLTTRRTETELELRDGQTFAIAGLLNNTVTSQLQKIPGIGDIPILGLLFQSKAARKDNTELVVMITPQILRAGSPGAATALPGLVDPYLPPPARLLPSPPPYGPRGAAPQGSVTPDSKDNARSNGRAAESAQPVSTPRAPSAAPVAPAKPTPATAPPPPAKPTKGERQAMERTKNEEQTRQVVEAKTRQAEQQKAAQQARVDARRAAEVKKQQDEAARVQAIQKAEADRRAEEARKRQEEADRKHGKELADAEARLKAAQTAYQQQLKRSSSSQNN
jgi:pilus assembly protein CpaC